MLNESSYFLCAEKVSKHVKSGDNQLIILREINLLIKRAETLAILGISGSGKTTLLTLLAGLDLPTSGVIYFDKKYLNALDEEERAKIRSQRVGFIFQSFNLLPKLTALENVMLPLEIQYVPFREAKERAIQKLSQMQLQDRLHHYPHQLSGGEQQRVAIARAFITNPEIIFADEMTGNLDTQTAKAVMDALFAINEIEKTTFVMVTHDSELANRCNRSLLLQDGMLHDV